MCIFHRWPFIDALDWAYVALTATQVACATQHHVATDGCEDLVDFCCEVRI